MAVVKFVLFGLVFVGFLTFLIFLLYGEFNDEIEAVFEFFSKQKEKQKAKYAVREYYLQSKKSKNGMVDAKLRELQYYRDLAKIDLCVLDTELKMLDVVAKAKAKHRGE